jgi:hypothetical protein
MMMMMMMMITMMIMTLRMTTMTTTMIMVMVMMIIRIMYYRHPFEGDSRRQSAAVPFPFTRNNDDDDDTTMIMMLVLLLLMSLMMMMMRRRRRRRMMLISFLSCRHPFEVDSRRQSAAVPFPFTREVSHALINKSDRRKRLPVR